MADIEQPQPRQHQQPLTILFNVIDLVMGINPEFLSKNFKHFFQKISVKKTILIGIN
jgi:hypothetical protein